MILQWLWLMADAAGCMKTTFSWSNQCSNCYWWCGKLSTNGANLLPYIGFLPWLCTLTSAHKVVCCTDSPTLLLHFFAAVSCSEGPLPRAPPSVAMVLLWCHHDIITISLTSLSNDIACILLFPSSHVSHVSYVVSCAPCWCHVIPLLSLCPWFLTLLWVLIT